MPIPSTQEIRKPLLEAFKGEAPRSFAINEFLEDMAADFGLNLSDLSSGDKTTFRTRINEAKSTLRTYNLLSNPSKNTYMITNAGTEVLEENPEIISDDYLQARKNKSLPVSETFGLEQLEPDEPVEAVEAENSEPIEEIQKDIQENIQAEDFSGQEFDEAPEVNLENVETVEAVEPEAEPEPEPEPEPELEQEPEQEQEPDYEPENSSDSVTPSRNIEDVIARYNSDLADEILMKTAAIASDRFEMLVIDLLSKMGYFAFQTARYTTESSGSDLIHGVILDNKTGSNPIYIQAKKLSPARTVGRSDIQDFVEELADKGGKGIFATTANFSEQAKIYANDERIMLIDGVKLANLMIANNFCVNVEKVFELKTIDTDSFSEYEE